MVERSFGRLVVVGSKLVAVSQICFMKVKRTVRVKSYCFPETFQD